MHIHVLLYDKYLGTCIQCIFQFKEDAEVKFNLIV